MSKESRTLRARACEHNPLGSKRKYSGKKVLNVDQNYIRDKEHETIEKDWSGHTT